MSIEAEGRGHLYEEYQKGVLKEKLSGMSEDPEYADADGNKAVKIELGESNQPEHGAIQERIRGEIRAAQDQIKELQQEIQVLEAQEKAVRELPVLFDSGNFSDIQSHLDQLSRVGIQEIRMGDKSYSPDDLKNIVDRTVRWSTDLLTSGGRIDDRELDNFLANWGVTRQKISPHSKYGFRDAIKQAIKRHDPTVFMNPDTSKKIE